MTFDWSSFQEEPSHASYAPCSLHSCEDFTTTHFRPCLTLGRVNEYSHATKALQPMTIVIPLENTIVALHQLHPLS